MAENCGFRAKVTVFKNMRYCQEDREGNGWLIILAERFADARGLRLAGGLSNLLLAPRGDSGHSCRHETRIKSER